MRELITCPRSKQKSSKRLIALVFAGASVLLSFILAGILMFYPEISNLSLNTLSTVIITFAVSAAGTQATTIGGGKQQEQPKYGRSEVDDSNIR